MAKGAVIMGLSTNIFRARVARACPNFEYILSAEYTVEDLGRRALSYDFCITDVDFCNRSGRNPFEKAIKVYLGIWKKVNTHRQAFTIVTPDQFYDRGLELKLPVMREEDFMGEGLNEFFKSAIIKRELVTR